MRINCTALVKKICGIAICLPVLVAAVLVSHDKSRAQEPDGSVALAEIDITLPPDAPLWPTASIEYPSNFFGNLNPVCRFRGDIVSPGQSAPGICSSVRQIITIPGQLHYGDLRVEFEAQCRRLDDCYAARLPGGPFSKLQCDDNFREELETECRRSLSVCGNVLRQCLETVNAYSGAIIAFADFARNSGDSGPGSTGSSVFGVPRPGVDDGDRALSTGESWVYVGEFDGGWITRNFELQEMVSVGESVTAINHVNVRSTHITLDPESGEWKNGEKTGLLQPGETVTITAIENLGRKDAAAHIWARIAR